MLLFVKGPIFILFIFFHPSHCFLEIIVGAGSFIYEKSICSWVTCCNKEAIPANFDVLRQQIRDNLFGQPLVQRIVVNALKAHWMDEIEPDKALTISFHGGPGVGKNYVSKFIVEALYTDGLKSPHVHLFNSRLTFPEVSKVAEYKKDLASWIKGNVSRCSKQIFIFDEVNQMPPGVLDILKPFIDHVSSVNGIKFTRSIFLFLSNTGTKVVNELTYNLWNRGVKREDMKLSMFENAIAQGAFNEKGGFHHSETIKSSLIDHYVPFLPLMKDHVIMCIEEEFEKINIKNPTKDQIKEILEYIDWGPDLDNGVFAKTGCKRISQKVRLFSEV